MKKFLILILTISLFVSCEQNKSGQLAHYKKVYQTAIKYGDYITAANAIYDQWTIDTMNAASYKDTLANLYFIRGNYVQTVILGKEVLAKKPDDQKLMELIAAADQGINNLQDALDLYIKIYGKTHDLFHLYQIASIQFNLGRVNECSQAVDAIIADPNSGTQKIRITINGQGQNQDVPYKAAALNIRGVIAKGLKQNDVAKKAFEDALAVAPDFVLAKNNMEDNKTQVGTAATKK